MATEEFNCFTCKKIKVGFDCQKCGNEIEQELFVPLPNLEGDRDTFNSTVEDDYDTIICENCNNEINYFINEIETQIQKISSNGI